MGGKKKSLANKLAKMSEEERARYLQHKADQEEEIRRRKEQLINIFLKNKVKKEDAFSRLNVAKINENWHQLLRKIKSMSLKEDVRYLEERTAHLLKLKNRTIDNLMEELDKAEEQYGTNFQSHMNSIKKLIDFSDKAVQDIKDDHEKELKDLLKKAENERQMLLRQMRNQEKFMQTLLSKTDSMGKTELRQNYDYYFKINDDVINQNRKDFEELRRKQEKEMNRIWRNIYQVVSKFIEETDKIRAHLAELHSLDLQSEVEMSENEATIARQQIEIKKLKENQEIAKEHFEREQKSLKDYFNILKEDNQKQKKNLHKLLQMDERNLRILTKCSNVTLKHLNEALKSLENVLNLIQICRKYETQEEKVMKFVDFSSTDLDIIKEDDSKDLETPLSPSVPGTMQRTFGTCKKLDKFWINYNKVEMSLQQMKSEEQKLKKENEQLKTQVKLLFEDKIYKELDKEFVEELQNRSNELFVTFSARVSRGKRVLC